MAHSADVMPETNRSGRSSPVPAEALRAVLRQKVSAVAVVTFDSTPPSGFTATSFNEVCLTPPLVSFCLRRRSSCWPALQAARHVAVHLLSDRQRALAERFATPGVDRFLGTDWRIGPHGVALLPDVLSWLVCRVDRRIPAGDHVIVLAEVVGTDYVEDRNPLLYHRRGYTALRPP